MWKKAVKVLVTQSCQILCDPTDCSPPGSSIHGVLQARILEWVSIPFCRGSFQPRDWTRIACIAGRLYTIWATREAPRRGHICSFLSWWWTRTHSHCTCHSFSPIIPTHLLISTCFLHLMCVHFMRLSSVYQSGTFHIFSHTLLLTSLTTFSININIIFNKSI